MTVTSREHFGHNSSVTIPSLVADQLPQGRHCATLDEFEQAFVLDAAFAASTTRTQAFADLLAALELLEQYETALVERMWLGGTFVSGKLDPGDIDVTFLLNEERYDSLSKTVQRRLFRLGRRGKGFAEAGLVVDAFFLVRSRIANPWSGPGEVSDSASTYMGIRGAWDDWWSRDRRIGLKDAPPLVEDADPVRGYVEVIVNGSDATL